MLQKCYKDATNLPQVGHTLGTEGILGGYWSGLCARAIRRIATSFLGKDLPVVIWKEGDSYVAVEVVTNVSSFGSTVEEALEKLREALELYLEDDEEMREYLEEVERGEVLFIQGSLQSSTNSSLVKPAC